MVSERVAEIDAWDNRVCSRVGASGYAPHLTTGLRRPFFRGFALAERATSSHQPVCSPLISSHPVQWDELFQRGCRIKKSLRHCCGLGVVAWLLALGWATSSWALSVVPRTFAELVGRADWVLIGTVTQITSAVEAKGERIYTYVTLTDLEVIKGEWYDTEYVLRVIGGIVDQRGEIYPGLPQFEDGRRYVLFIQGNFSALFPVVGLHQGVFRVEWDPGRQQTVVLPFYNQHQRRATRSSGGDSLGQSRQAMLLAPGVTVEAFVQRIQTQLHVLSQLDLGAGQAEQPGGRSLPGGALP